MGQLMSRFTDNLGYFFRGAWEDYVFPIFSPLHLFLLLVLVAGILLIAVFREKIRKDPKRTLRNFLLGGLILEQITQYSWYALAGTFTLGDGLPLYICRTAIPAIILAYLTGNYYAKTLSVFWGSLAAFWQCCSGHIPLLFPAPHEFYLFYGSFHHGLVRGLFPHRGELSIYEKRLGLCFGLYEPLQLFRISPEPSG